jgi:hypothetical protein
MATPWDIVYYKAADGSVPVFEYYVDACTSTLIAYLNSVLDAVAAAPPPAFSGGGRWEAMHGGMGGFYEVRATGPNRRQHRLFCVLENGEPDELTTRGLPRPAIAVITGMWKPNATLFGAADYGAVSALGADYRAQFPRRVAADADVDAFLDRLEKKAAESDSTQTKAGRKRRTK